jgi:hypothetical protein
MACRACGAPSAPDALRCDHCGSQERYDAATRERLVAHRARMRRALQELRALVSAEVSWALAGGKVYLIAVLFLGLPMGGLVAGGFAPLLFLLLAQPRGPLAVVGVLVTLAGAAVGLAAGLFAVYGLAKRFAARSRQQARDLVLGMQATTPVVCPSCGGHAAVVALGPHDHAPCPWCATALLPAGEASLARETARVLLAQHAAAAARLARPPRRAPAARKPPPVDGYEVVGGTVVRGETFGVPLRAFNDLHEGAFVHRIEAPVDLGVAGETFLVRPEVEGVMRSLAREWGYALPDASAPSPREGWRVYARDAVEPVPAAVGPALDRLGAADALLLDPAGLSVWRRGVGLAYAWGLVREHHETVARLARALRPEAGASPGQERGGGRRTIDMPAAVKPSRS